MKSRNNYSSNLQPSPPVMTIHFHYQEFCEKCFPPLLTIQIYHVDSKTTGTFPAKKRSRLCHLFLYSSLMYFILMTYPYLILCVTAPFAKSLGIIDLIKLSLLSYTVQKFMDNCIDSKRKSNA